ncbi:hypothetical protein AtEden1_Chr3g0198081 [Arabidopsis thaliana]
MERSCFKKLRVADSLSIGFKLHPYLTLIGMKLSGVIYDTTGYIFNRGIKFLTNQVRAYDLGYSKDCLREKRRRIEFSSSLGQVMWTVMDRRVNSWSRTADKPKMGVSEPRGPASTYEVLVVTRMTGPNDVKCSTFQWAELIPLTEYSLLTFFFFLFSSG